jgi:hypothetical protein
MVEVKCAVCGRVADAQQEFPQWNPPVCQYCVDWYQAGKKAAEELANAVNVAHHHFGRAEKAVAVGFAHGLIDEHRSLQQAFFRSLVKFLELYQNAGHDDRNAKAVELAGKLVEAAEGHHLPCI